ncbi:MAG TPA: glycosyltransferase [Bacteroidia bacterium]|nr:glycosyltransferase [Bacteroidia bacterium]
MVEKRKTIVILTPGFAKNEQDTTCIPILQQYVSTLSAMRPDLKLHVVAFQYPFTEGHYKWKGIDVYSAGGKGTLYSRLLTWRRVNKELKRIQGESEICIIHSCWLTECTVIGQRFSQKNGIKHIAYAMGQDVLKKNKYLKLLRFSQMQIIAISESVADNFHKLTGSKVNAIIPAGIDNSNINIKSEPRTVDVIGVGALSSLKNYELFIEIITLLKKDFPEIRSVIIGEGKEQQLLNRKIRDERLYDNVKLMGAVPHDEVFSYMNRSKILLHTSSYEGQSTVIMEALATGLSVVCFDVGRMNSDKIKVCATKVEMVNRLKALLSNELDHSPQVLFSMNDTVNEFLKVYRL